MSRAILDRASSETSNIPLKNWLVGPARQVRKHGITVKYKFVNTDKNITRDQFCMEILMKRVYRDFDVKVG